ncbi:phage tail protein (plasmid) [Chromobacterium amazonense]|uniref:phage tail protein n=1 Tax=Chromobacterium amazonense TaxID=1382803 RepID=UPI00237D454E|nr:phage tail protein [Chromobacterium amazonense]MDE1713881.1 phage tail protein [Chromobacterium amazonense]
MVQHSSAQHHQRGAGAADRPLVHKSYGDDTLVLKEATGSEYRVWHSGNDGSIIRKRRYRISSDDKTSLDNDVVAGEMGFNYATSSGVNGPFIAFGGLSSNIDYSCQLTADYQNGNLIRFRTRNDDQAKRWNPWRTLIHEDYLTGQVAFFAMANPPQGWLKARGNAVSRTEYAALFAAIGTTYGAGDGSTTFNLPDLRGEFIRGWDDGRTVDNGRGFGTSQASQNLWHDHSIPTPTATAGNDTVLVDNSGAPLDYGCRLASNEVLAEWGKSPNVLRYATYGQGGNESRPRNVALLACIKY